MLCFKKFTMRVFAKRVLITVGIASAIGISSCQRSEKEYPIKPVPFTDVKVTDNFWAPRIKKNQEITIPIALKQCEITGRIKNFKIAGKLETGSFCSMYPFDDSDIYKIIEGASFSLQSYPSKELETYIDTLIHYIALAQEPDGYLYTNRTIDPNKTHEWAGNERWVNDPQLSHELYNLGHLYEAAVAHFAATGKRNLLDIAIKSADLVDKEFGPGKLKYYPGHQVIEMGLVKLYMATKNERYLNLAKFFLDTRGPGGEEYCQAHERVFDQDKIVGHAVRATYMYAGMADVAAITGDEAYSKPLFNIWNDLLNTKYYITGGIGSSGSNEGFGDPYDLPNMSAYCETCASIGLVYWNYRMFLLTGDSKYYDILERTLYNALMSGVSLSGDHFFYPNVLESRGQHERSEWFGCACCPGNICRFLPSLPGYIYAVKDDQLYANLYVNSTANITIDGTPTEVEQTTKFPNDGKISIRLNPKESKRINLKLRIPSWVDSEPVPTDLYQFSNKKKSSIAVAINGEKQNIEIKNGYISISRVWNSNDIVELTLPLDIKMIKANPKVKADIGKVAIQRGPLVYCLEWPDNNGKILSYVIDSSSSLEANYNDTLLNGLTTIKGKAHATFMINDKAMLGNAIEFTAIPYYAWANRGAGEMMVWIPTTPESSRPTPAPTIAATSQIKASEMKKSLVAINDQELPENSNDRSVMLYHWWPKKGTTEWIEYNFKQPETISETAIYWFDEEPWGDCRIPQSWKILYNKNGKWIPVKNTENYVVEKDKINSIHFEPVKTTAVRMEITFKENFSSGLYEWSIK